MLRAGLRGKRLRLSDDERRRLAVKAQALGREALAQIASVATPATLLRWYRCLIAAKYDGSKNRSPGRPPTAKDIRGSRSWMRYRLPRRKPSHRSVRFLATCFIHSPLGSDVIPPMHTQRVAISMCDFKFEAHHSFAIHRGGTWAVERFRREAPSPSR